MNLGSRLYINQGYHFLTLIKQQIYLPSKRRVMDQLLRKRTIIVNAERETILAIECNHPYFIYIPHLIFNSEIYIRIKLFPIDSKIWTAISNSSWFTKKFRSPIVFILRDMARIMFQVWYVHKTGEGNLWLNCHFSRKKCLYLKVDNNFVSV